MRTDRSRTAAVKARTLTRRSERRSKSAQMFLCWAFPAGEG